MLVRPCSAAYGPISILGRVCGVVFSPAGLGAGPASSVSLVRLATRLLASTRDSFGSDGVDPEGDKLVAGVNSAAKIKSSGAAYARAYACSRDKFN